MAGTISDFIAEENERIRKQNAGAASVVLATVEESPDEVAGAINLATDFGKETGNPVPPVPMVKEYRNIFQSQVEQSRANKILNEAPTLAEFLRNPENAALVRDDLGAMSQWDRIKSAFAMGDAKATEKGHEFARDAEAALETSALGRGLDSVGEAFDHALLTNADGTPNFMGRVANWLRETGQDGVPRQMVGGPDVTPEDRQKAILARDLGTLYDGAKAVIKQFEDLGFSPMKYDEVNGIGSALAFIAENLAMSAPEMGAAIASGGFMPMYQIASLGGEVNQELAEKLPDMDLGQRVSIATGAGVAMSALEMFGLSKILGPIGGDAASKMVADVATEAAAGTLTKRIVSNGGSEVFGRLLTAAIAEGSTEALQEAITVGVTSFMGGEYADGEIMDRLLQGFFAGAGAGAGIRGGVEAVSGAARLMERDQAKADAVPATQEKIANIADAAANTKLRERVPDRFRGFVERALGGTQAENMYVSGDQFAQYFQSIGMDPYEIAGALDGVSVDDLDVALSHTGGMLKIPSATYAASIAGTEYDQWFRDNAKFSPDDFSSEEAREFNERADEIRQQAWEEIETARREMDEFRTFEEEMMDTMISRNRAAGMGTDEARTNAQIIVSGYMTEAERAGMTPTQFMRDVMDLPDVRGSNTEVARRDVSEIDLALADLRMRKDGKTATTPLLDFIRERGGIDDIGGELAARNADAGRRPGQRSLARKLDENGKPMMRPDEAASGKRFGWDDTAQAAIEAGFLADDPAVAEWMAAQDLGDRVAPDLTPILQAAIDRELAGQAERSAWDVDGQKIDQRNAELDQMEEYLASLGVSLDMTDAEIRAAIEADQARDDKMYAQSGEIATESAAFKEWFGASKIVNSDGSPKTVFHGSNAGIKAFDHSKAQDRQGRENALGLGRGKFYLSDDRGVADAYAVMRGGNRANVGEYFVRAEKPMNADEYSRRYEVISGGRGLWSGYDANYDMMDRDSFIAQLDEQIRDEGFDAIIDDMGQIAVFDPTQIKSVNNRGTWDKNDPRVLYQTEPVQSLDDIENFAKSIGVSLMVSNSGDFINLSKIVAENRGQGSGSRVMEMLTDYADAQGKKIALTPSKDFGGSISRLGKFYKRFGFVENKGKNRDFGTREAMVREPQSPRQLFQMSAPFNARGAISYSDQSNATINLFKAKNLSTFNHEAGHLFLEMKRRVAAKGYAHAQEELQEIRKWWRSNAKDVARDGMKSMPDVTLTEADVISWLDLGTTGNLMKDAAIDVGTEEQFARGWEAYVMEGKAPSIELKGVFSRMAAWLARIYKQIAKLNVTLTPEIRGVMDRIIATDAQIERAKQEAGETAPIFATAEMMGLTDEQYARFVKLREVAQAEAHASVLNEVMGPIRREQEEAYKAEKERVRKLVTEEMQRRPIYRAVQELRKGVTFDGQEVVTPKLSRKDIEIDYGPGYLKYLPGAMLDKDGEFKGGHAFAVFTSNGGAHPDVIAEIYGYPSGKELLDAMMNAVPIKDAIDAEVERVMKEFHGDPLEDGSIEVKALDALHSDRRTEWLATELKAVRAIVDGGVDMTAKEARRVAVETLSRAPVRDAVASHRYLASERKYGEEAYQLAAKLSRTDYWKNRARFMKTGEGNMPVAAKPEQDMIAKLYTAKRRQLMNHALYMESRKVAKAIERLETKSAKLDVSDAKLGKSRDINYAKAARAVAAKFGLARGDSEFDFAAWLEQVKHEDPAKFSALTDAIATYTQDAKHYKSMIVSELQAVSDAIDGFMELGKQTRKMEIEGRLVEKADAIADLVVAIDAAGRTKNPALDRDLTKGERAVKTVTGMWAALKRVEHWARTMDGGEQGPFTRYMVKPIMGALDNYRMDKEAKFTKMLGIINAKREVLNGRAIHAPELNGHTFTNKAQVIHAILHTGNQSNMAKLLIGRGWSKGWINQRQDVTKLGKARVRKDGSPIMTKGELDRSAWDAFLNRMISEGVITSEDIQMVNDIWALMDETKRPAQTAHKKMFGYYFGEIEGEGYDTPAGRLNGGYVPAILDNDASNDGVMRESEAALDQQAAGFMLPTAGRGFTQQRVENYTKPLALDLTLLPAHLDKVLRFTHLDPAVRQVHSLISDRRFSDVLAEHDPTLIDNMLTPWLQRVAQQSVSSGSASSSGRAMDHVLNTLRKRVGFNTMFGNIINVLQQIPSIPVAATAVKPRYMKDAVIRLRKDPLEVREEVFAMSPFMRDRVKNATREMQMRVQEILRAPSKYGDALAWIDKHGYFLQQGVQNWIDVPVWMAAYNQSVANGMTEADAVFEADSVVRRTMVGMNPEDVSMFESGAAWKRIFTMFYTFFNGQLNYLSSEAKITARQYGWNGKRKFFMLYLFGVLAPSFGAELLAKAFRGELGDEDDDGAYWDDVLGLFFTSQARYATAMVPLLGHGVQLMLNQFNDERYDDKLSPSPAISQLERAGRSIYTVPNAVFGDGRASSAVGDGLTALSLATGVPLNWLAKPLGYAASVAEGRSDPENAWDLVKGAVSGRDGSE